MLSSSCSELVLKSGVCLSSFLHNQCQGMAVWSILVEYEAVCWFGFQTMANTSLVKELQASCNVGMVQTEEIRRNSILADLLFISRRHPLAALVISFYDRYAYLQAPQRYEVMEEINPTARYHHITNFITNLFGSRVEFISCEANLNISVTWILRSEYHFWILNM